MTTGHTAAKNSSRRKLLRVSGLVLWILVLAAGFAAWRSSHNPNSEVRQTQTSGAPTTGPGTRAGVPPLVDLRSQPTGTARDAAAADPKNPGQSGAESIWDPDGIEGFQLIERSGREVSKASLLGHAWAVSFIFTRCAGPCSRVSSQMKVLQDRLQDTDVRLVTITVDPKYDTPDVLRNYADLFGADPQRWLFLTGDQDQVYRLIIDSFRMPVQEMVGKDRIPGWEVLHTTNILHVDAHGRVVGKYDAQVDTDMVALRRALVAVSVSNGPHETGPPASDALPAAAAADEPQEPVSHVPADRQRPPTAEDQ